MSRVSVIIPGRCEQYFQATIDSVLANARGDVEVIPIVDGNLVLFEDGRKTIMAKCLISDKKIQRVSFLPFLINNLGQPEPLSAEDKRSGEVYEYVMWCCQDQKLDTNFVREGDEVVVCT